MPPALITERIFDPNFLTMQHPVEPRRPPVLDPTRAQPEPWFVGNGKGLMIGVLAIVAVLFVLRAASMWVIAREAWAWWTRPSPAGVPPPTYREAAIVPLPHNKVPPRDPALANRPARGDPSAAFGPDAYPAAALRADEQGRTVAWLKLDESGAPSACAVEISSGSTTLDERTCAIGMARLRFDPARDSEGQPIPAGYRLPVRWVLPTE